MSLQLILGNSGSGKTHVLYEEIIKQSIENPKKQYLVIVPEQYTMKTQKELVMRHPNGGILNIDVLSFGRLAHRIFGELGINPGVVLDDEGKNLVLRKIAGDYEKDLKVIGKNLKKFGYISEVKSVISEFMQYDIDLEGLEELKSKIEPDTMLAYKLEDIYKIYKGFREHLQGQYITGEEMLDCLTRVVEDSQILRDSVITFDGFTGFTPVQNRLIGKLMKVASKVYVTVTIPKDENAYTYYNPYQLFALSKETVHNLMQMCRDQGVELEKSMVLPSTPVYRFQNNRELAFLEENIFRYSGKKYGENGSEKVEAISIHALKNPEDESLWVASKIRQLVRKEGYRYRDIAIITSSMETYGGYLKNYCEAYEIPVFSDQTRSILLNSFVEYIRSMLSMIEENYTYNATFRCVKAGSGKAEVRVAVDGSKEYYGGRLGVLGDSAIDALENYVLEYGIKGYKKWSEPWTVRNRGVSEKQLEYLNEQRQKLMDHYGDLHKALKKRTKTVEDICTSLYEYFEVNKVQFKVDNRVAYFQEKGLMAYEKEYSQIYGVVLELMDKLVSVLGQEPVTLKEFMELLDAGLQEARIGMIPPSIDQVLIGDLQRTRIDHVKALFFVGVSDAYLPGKMGGSGLLSEQDRDEIWEQSWRLKPGSKEQMYLQKFYLYMNLTKPTEKLLLSYGKSGTDGKSARPSYVVGELCKLFPQLVCEEVEFKLEERLELTEKVGLNYIIQGLQDEGVRETPYWKELYAWYQNHSECGADLEKILDGFYYKRVQENLTPELAQDLYGTLLKNSVSRLEKFAACPYAHFLNYGLKLREREIYEFEASDVGTVLHDSLKTFALLVKDSKKLWTQVTEAEKETWVEQSIEQVVNDYKHGVFQQSERDEYMIQRLQRIMKKTVWAVIEQLKAGDFNPEEFEVGFGCYDTNGNANQSLVKISNTQSMEIGGFIDRIDLCKKGNQALVKVVDYKSSSKDIDLNDLWHGLQLQLFVYMNEAMKLVQKKNPQLEVIPAGNFYYHMDDPIVEEKKQKTIEEITLNALKVKGLVNEVAVKDMDRNFQYTSDVIPVKITKSTGAWDRTSKNIKQEDLETLLAFTDKKIEELGREIAGGNIAIHPYQYDDGSKKQEGCTYCEFKRVCAFDKGRDGQKYHKLVPYPKGFLLKFMSGEEDEDGDAMDQGTTTGN